MNDLFPITETLSPRLEWMRRHDLQTLYHPAPDGKEWPDWCAWQGEDNSPHDGNTGEGDTEDEALIAWAQ